jgi:cytochrome c55X
MITRSKETKTIRKFFIVTGLLCMAQSVLSFAQEGNVRESNGSPHTSAPPQQHPVTVSSADIDTLRQEELRYMVQQDCGSCHGMTLKGGLGPSLLPERIATLPDQYLFDAIYHGRKGAPMPPWAPILKTEEIHWIVQQLKLGQLGQIPNSQTPDKSHTKK